MRIVMRVGFQVANPLTRTNSDTASRYPAAVLVPSAGGGESSSSSSSSSSSAGE
jgi:hypothetical protein